MTSIIKQVTKANSSFGVYQILYLISLLFGAILISCNTYIKSEDSVVQAQLQNDTAYLNNLYTNSVYGIQIADIAKNKSSNQKVRIFAEKASLFQQQLKHRVDSTSQVNNVHVSAELTANQKSLLKKLSDEKTEKFDRQFVVQTEEQMTDQMDLLENISSRSENNEITTWAVSMLPIVQAHMDTFFTFKQRQVISD
jgi:predicted outer membrane protein